MNFNFKRSSIPHLLGINTSYLTQLKIFDSSNNYKLLKQMLKSPLIIHYKASKGEIIYDKLFSKQTNEKIDSFERNTNVFMSDIEAVCIYASDNTYTTQTDFEKCDRIVIKSYPNGEIGVIFFVKENSYYVAMSNRIYENFEAANKVLYRFLHNQTITYPNGLNI